MTRALALTEPASPRRERQVPITWLATAVLGLAAVSNLLLPAFLGLAPWIDGLLVVGCTGGLAWLILSGTPVSGGVDLRTIAICVAIALGLLLLGGEGRLLSAATDWRVRDAVLADISRHPWPFHYRISGGEDVLRAPLGMYLIPSLVGSAGQAALDGCLLVSNTLMLGLLFSLASVLFSTPRDRRIAIAILLLFSGMDAVGVLIMWVTGHPAPFYHIENWAPHSQFTAPYTQMTWAPQHAIAGWACALFFLLWQQRKLPIGLLAATILLFAFWSPIATAGALPFAALAAWRDRTRLRITDLATAAAAGLIASPALLYQHAGAASVGAQWNPIAPGIYVLAILLEAVPLLAPVLLQRPASRFGRDTLLLAAAIMLLAPLIKIGTWNDFQMRTTIVPIIITAAAFADLWLRREQARCLPSVRALTLILAIGSLTILSELFPVLTMRPAPPPRCSTVTAWNLDQPPGGWTGAPATYVTPVGTLPSLFRSPARAMIDPARDPKPCWPRPWFTPAWTGR